MMVVSRSRPVLCEELEWPERIRALKYRVLDAGSGTLRRDDSL